MPQKNQKQEKEEDQEEDEKDENDDPLSSKSKCPGVQTKIIHRFNDDDDDFTVMFDVLMEKDFYDEFVLVFMRPKENL